MVAIIFSPTVFIEFNISYFYMTLLCILPLASEKKSVKKENINQIIIMRFLF